MAEAEMMHVLIDDDGAATECDMSEWLALAIQGASADGSSDGFWDLSDGVMEAFRKRAHSDELSGDEVAVTGAVDESSNMERQREEAEAMAAMYGASFLQLSATEWLFRYDIAKGVVGEMRVTFGLEYPSHRPPELTLDIPGCRGLKEIRDSLRAEFTRDVEVVFSWAERFQELCKQSAERLQVLVKEKKVKPDARFPSTTDVAQDLRLHRRSTTGMPYWPRRSYEQWISSAKCCYYAGTCQCCCPGGGPCRAEVMSENDRRRKEAEARDTKRREEARRLAAWKANPEVVSQPQRKPHRDPVHVQRPGLC